ncbi:MAG: putative DNA binding domain-containing protein [Salinivirgaceae bacterium]|nr:putative DNA binding domain-containing protein [Salinivirgaceae bacterium]
MEEKELNEIIRSLISLPKECEWAEFKLNFHGEEELGKNISALSNGACLQGKPYGYILYGIDDASITIKGTTFRPKSQKIKQEELENWILQRLSPRIDVEFIEGRYNDLPVALVKIPAAQGQPTSFLHNEYIKVGSITRSLKEFPEKERKIWNSVKKDVPFEQQTALVVDGPDKVVSLLSTQTYFELLNISYPTTQAAVIEKFVSEGFVRKENGKFAITKLGAILFAKDLSIFENLYRKAVRVIQYNGKNKLETLKDQEGRFGYIVGFKGLVKYIMDILPSNEIINQAFRTEKTMYPELAIRELVANALIHQDFSISGTGPLIEIYSDRIEISNPGSPLITPNRFIDEYQSRNEKLASVMRRFGICEEKGSGMDKVVFQIEFYQLPAYNVQIQEKHTKVILYSYMPFAKMSKDDRIRACYQHACLCYVTNEKMTNTSLRKRFEISQENASMASRIIKDTIMADLIKEDNPDSTSKKYIKYIPIWA